jgi:predicted oxidoreductase
VRAPFYAVKVVAGSLGTFAGLKTDASARVLDAAGRPIERLYAVGNDAESVMGGRYPAGGITLGPAMTFGYIAAHHAAGIPLDNNRPQGAEPQVAANV